MISRTIRWRTEWKNSRHRSYSGRCFRKTCSKHNPRILGSTGFPLFNPEGTFHCCICLKMNYIILRNRKRRGGLLGTLAPRNKNKTDEGNSVDCWIRTDTWKMKYSPSELFTQQPLCNLIGDWEDLRHAGVYRAGKVAYRHHFPANFNQHPRRTISDSLDVHLQVWSVA